jgi:beta-lactamase superfamily II metal-dependent hydrolase
MTYPNASNQSLGYEIDFLAVGDGAKSGDAIALRFGNLGANPAQQRVVVIDGGFAGSGDEIVQHVNAFYGTNRVDLVISTHPDADHAGGLEVVLEKCEVGALWMHLPWNHTDDIAKMFNDGRVTDTSVREALRKSLDNARALERLASKRKIPIREPFAGVADESGSVFVLGPSIPFYESLLPGFRGVPEPKEPISGFFQKAVGAMADAVKTVAELWHIETLDDSGETSAENNSSAIVMVVLGNECLLFTSDAGIPALTGAVSFLDAVHFDYSRITFIQVPHHGSKRNVGPTILNRLVGPKLNEDKILRTAFVSAAKDGIPKHPSKKVLNALKRRGVGVHVTAGMAKCHYKNAPGWPARGWTASTPMPFFMQVEE